MSIKDLIAELQKVGEQKGFDLDVMLEDWETGGIGNIGEVDARNRFGKTVVVLVPA